MTDGPVRAMTDAEVFAALCALPKRFRFTVERIALSEPDPDLLATMPTPTSFRDEMLVRKVHEEALSASVRPRTFWTVTISAEPHGNGAAFYGRATSLDGAWGLVRMQIAAFTEAL